MLIRIGASALGLLCVASGCGGGPSRAVADGSSGGGGSGGAAAIPDGGAVPDAQSEVAPSIPPGGTGGSGGASAPEIAVEMEVGPAGGTLTTEALELSIPAGALVEPTMISARTASPDDLPDYLVPAGPFVEFGPDGSTFAAPVTIKMRVLTAAAADEELVAYWSNDLGEYEQVASRIEGQWMVFEVSHFSRGLTAAQRKWGDTLNCSAVTNCGRTCECVVEGSRTAEMYEGVWLCPTMEGCTNHSFEHPKNEEGGPCKGYDHENPVGEKSGRLENCTEFYPCQIEIHRSRYPQSADHVSWAISRGWPYEVAKRAGGTRAARTARRMNIALFQSNNPPPRPPMADADEYPPAFSTFTYMNGVADVAYIDSSDNRGAGACMGTQAAQILPGGLMRFEAR